jgi:hypothetical protein
MEFTAPPKFKILVAGIVQPSDPSRGLNAVKARTGFELQIVNCPDGTNRIGGPTAVVPPPSLADHTAAIQVAAPNYWDPNAVPPPPFYWKEEVQTGEVYLVASDNFGAGLGSGVGPVANIANDLATALNLVQGVEAASDGVDTVYVTSKLASPLFPVKASNDFSVVFGGVTFMVSSGGTVLNGGTECHQTYYLRKSMKTQTPPVILP